MTNEISVPIEWLKSLAELSAECQKDQDKWNLSEKPLMPYSISKLIGYSSSAKTLINLKTNENPL
jgi:hypothetical protein